MSQKRDLKKHPIQLVTLRFLRNDGEYFEFTSWKYMSLFYNFDWVVRHKFDKVTVDSVKGITYVKPETYKVSDGFVTLEIQDIVGDHE